MRKGKNEKLLKTVLLAALTVTLALPVSPVDLSAAADTKETNAVAVKLNKISLSSKSYAELKSISMIPSTDGQLVSFTYSIYNGDQSDIDFIDYWVKLQSRSGAKFGVKQISRDKNKNKIAPQSRQVYTFYSTVGSNIKITDLVFQFIKWDFNSSSFEKSLGQITIPAGYKIEVLPASTISIDAGGSLFDVGLTNVTASKSENGQFISLEAAITNSGFRNMTLPTYTFFLMTGEGLMYQLNGTTEGLTIQAKETKKVQLSGNIPGETSTKDWKVVMVLPEADSKLDIPLATFGLPEKLDNDAQVEMKKTLEINGVSVEGTVVSVGVGKNDVNHNVSISLRYENKGNKTVSIPNYQYNVVTTEGISYPLTDSADDLSINAREKREIYLSSNFPSTVNADQLRLVISQPSTDNKTSYPVATYHLKVTESGSGSVGHSVSYSNRYGNYQVKLEGMERLPWGDQDIIAAEVSFSNNGSASLPVPSLSGLFEFDGVAVEADRTKVIRLDNVLSIPAKSTIKTILYVMVPYTYEYSNVKIELQEKSGTATLTLATFRSASGALKLPVVKTGEAHIIADVGKRAEVTIKNAYKYQGESTDLYYAELVMENKEKRPTKLTRLEGYLKAADGAFFPAKVSTVTSSIAPGGKALLSFWAPIPKSYSVGPMELIVAQGVTGTSLATPDAASDAMIRGSLLEHAITTAATGSYTGMKSYPYMISLRKIRAQTTTVDQMKLDFEYDLSKVKEYDMVAEKHKLVLEFISGSIKFEKEYEFETGTMLLSLGSGLKGSFTYDETDLLTKAQTSGNFTLNVYDKFEDHKRLIGTSSLKWFVEN